jgi:hypothetical protein
MYPDRPMDYEGMSQVNIEYQYQYQYWQWYPTQGLRPRTPTPSAGPAHFATPPTLRGYYRKRPGTTLNRFKI